mgnify:FL=1|jgi:hypothetical protein|tara:strand:+ start:1570 stop:1818 length:249 start_codon:yes stop_codon:yes gene_type:complete
MTQQRSTKDTGSPSPRLPEAPREYNQMYMADLIRTLEFFISQTDNPGILRGTKITLTELPTSSTDLEVGALFNDNGTIKIKE